MKKGRIKKVTITYYTPNGEISHTETEYWPQIKYPIIGWVTGSFGWTIFETAKEELIKKLGSKSKNVEYIDI